MVLRVRTGVIQNVLVSVSKLGWCAAIKLLIFPCQPQISEFRAASV